MQKLPKKHLPIQKFILTLPLKTTPHRPQPIYRLLECNRIKSGRLFTAPKEVEDAYEKRKPKYKQLKEQIEELNTKICNLNNKLSKRNYVLKRLRSYKTLISRHTS